MPDQVVVTVVELKILFNLAHHAGKQIFNVQSLLPKAQIFQGAIGARCKIALMFDREYKQAWREIPPDIQTEIPRPEDERELLLQAGILLPTNWESILEAVNRAQNAIGYKGGRLTYLAFDTVSLRNRLFSVLCERIPWRERDRVACAVTPKIREELDFVGKYNGQSLKKLAGLQPAGRRIVDNFWNQPPLEQRQKRLGMIDLQKIRRGQYREAPNVEASDPDGQILDSLEKLAEKYDIIFLTSDGECTSRVVLRENIQGVHVVLPPMRDLSHKAEASWEEFATLLYLSAVRFGAVELSFGGDRRYELYGIWRGKQAESWEREDVAVQGQAVILTEFRTEIDLLRAGMTEEVTASA